MHFMPFKYKCVKLRIKCFQRFSRAFFLSYLRDRGISHLGVAFVWEAVATQGCARSLSGTELSLKSEDLLPYVKTELARTDHIAIMWFCYVFFQFHYIQQTFYKEIDFLLLHDVCFKTLSLWKNSPFPWQKKIATIAESEKARVYSKKRKQWGNIY